MKTIRVAAGTSATDLQTIIDNAPDGATIRLDAGKFWFDETVFIERDGIKVVGSGLGKTVILADSSLQGEPVFQVGSELFVEDYGDAVGLSGDAALGGNAVKLSSAAGLQAGDSVWIEARNTEAFLDSIGDHLWREDKPLRTAMATIVEVRGDTVILDRALPFEFPAAISTLEKIETVAGVTLSGFTVRGDFGASDPGDFTNTLASEKGGMVILVNATTDTIVNDIEILEPGSSGLVVAKSLDADISDIRVDGAHNKGDGGNGYGIWIRDVYDSSFSGLDITDTRHAVVFASATSAEGNVVSVTHTNRDINFHGGLDHGNVVTVVDSVRNLDEQGYMSPVVFVNGGTDYGAPTGRNVNTVTFSHADGTVRADEIKAAAQGATLFGNGGNDTLRGGAGDDRLDGGTGDDVFRASAGADTITGGSGNDRVYFHNMMAESYVTRIDGKLAIVTGEAVTYVTGVDRLNFKDGSIRLTPEAETSGTSFGALKYSDDAPIVARQQAAVAISDDRFVVADDAVGDVSAELADSGFGGSRPVQQAGAVYHSAPVDFDMTDTIVVDPADHLFT